MAANQEDPPLVQSISYGCDESEIPAVYAILFEMEMLKVDSAARLHHVYLFL